MDQNSFFFFQCSPLAPGSWPYDTHRKLLRLGSSPLDTIARSCPTSTALRLLEAMSVESGAEEDALPFYALGRQRAVRLLV